MSHQRTSIQDPAGTPSTTGGTVPGPTPRRHARWPMRVVVAVSMITGLAAAVAGVVVSVGGTEPVVDGLVLFGFAVGWTLLAALSVRFTDQPQRWAAVPAAVMGGASAGPHCSSSPPATPPWTRSAGYGRLLWSECSSGSPAGSAGNCPAAAAGGCSTRSSPSPPSPRSAAGTTP